MTRGIADDLAGRIFGHLKVLSRVGSDQQGNALWECLCECGRTVGVRGSFLKKRQIHCSSGCPLLVRKFRNDLTGQKFGRLTAIERLETSGDLYRSLWKFQCDCGTIFETSSDYVLNSGIKSCGCLGRESRVKHGQSQTPEYHRAARQKWAAANPAKVIENVNKRRGHLKKCIPVWLTAEQRERINEIYLEARERTRLTGQTSHVDHIVPLRGKRVSGLHVPWNLQILTGTENVRKSAKMPDDVC